MNNKTQHRCVRIDLSFAGRRSLLEKALVRLGKTHTSNVIIESSKSERTIKSNPGRDVTIHLKFTGNRSKLEKTLETLGNFRSGSVGIDTVPLPE